MANTDYGKLHIHRVESQRRVVGRTKRRWCFICRRLLVHDKAVYTEVLQYDQLGDLINGYYEPYLRYECRGCGGEHLKMVAC